MTREPRSSETADSISATTAGCTSRSGLIHGDYMAGLRGLVAELNQAFHEFNAYQNAYHTICNEEDGE